jgi:uncharacterized RDD family membrane protein YckC
MGRSTDALPGARPAGFLIRAVAYLVDAFLLSFVGGAFPYLVIVTSNPGPNGQSSTAIAGSSLLVSLIYFVIFWSNLGGGRTLGMRLFGLRVVADDGGPVAILEAIVRWIGLWVSFALCFVGVLWVAGDAKKQGWHDKMAHTLVVYA